MLATMVGTVLSEEQARSSAKTDEQVQRQRLSLASDEDRPAVKQRLQAITSDLASRAAAVEEALEELRAEAADCEEED